MSAAGWRRLRILGGATILALLVWRFGASAFLDGFRAVDARSLLLATAIAVPTTVAAAWRWRLVARGLGVGLGLGPAVARYYRAQFLNVVLPGGVLGDVHRGLRAGQDAGDTAGGLRAVFWERAAGQAVQLALAITVLLALPVAERSSLRVLVLAAIGMVVLLALLDRFAAPGHTAWWARALHVGRTDLRRGVLARGIWPGVLLTSTVAVAGYVATFLLAARTAGVDASTARLLPLGMLTLVAMAVPANIAGWGPREGVAAWAFAASGLGAAAGLSTAVVFGVLTFVACLPGALVLLVMWWRGRRRDVGGPAERLPLHAVSGGHD